MALNLTEVADLPHRGVWSSTVLDFAESGYNLAEVDLEGRDALKATKALDQAIRYEMLPNVRSKKRGDHVFLVRTPDATGSSRSQS